MSEPAVLNETSFHCDVLPILDRDGARSRVAIVKATYAIAPGELPRLAPEQRGARLGDVLWGPPEIPDIRLPGDYCGTKPGTDFVLSGYAVPPEGFSGDRMNVVIRVVDREMILCVHGERMWETGTIGVVPGPSRMLTRVPLAWSFAYGGQDFTNPAQPFEEPRNPVGKGIARDVDRLIGSAAPQIEALDQPVRRAGVGATPAGCAAIGRNFAARRVTAGTYGDDYIEKLYPARPTDYREEHENCAVPDFVFVEPLRGGERVTVAGVNPRGILDFLLPKWRLLIEAEIDGETIERRPHLDTVIVNSDAMELELVWRGLFRCPPKMRRRFVAVRIRSKEYRA